MPLPHCRPDQLFNAIDIALKTPDIVDLSYQMKAMGQSMGILQKSVREGFEQMERRFNETDRKVNELNSKVDNVSEKIDHVHAFLEHIEAHLGGIQEDVLEVKGEVVELRADLGNAVDMLTGQLQTVCVCAVHKKKPNVLRGCVCIRTC